MAQKTVAKLRDSVSGILQGLNLNNVTNLNTAFERTARQLTQEIDIFETEARQSVVLYDGVIDYLAPTSIFGSTLIDFQSQGRTRSLTDYVYKKEISQFDRTKAWLPNGTQITFESRNGTPIMRIVSTRPTPKIELDSMTETTGWTVGGSASGLTTDSTVLWNDPASLRFTLTGASSGTLTKAISSQDLTSYVGVGVAFLAVYIPTATNLTSIEVRLGSDSSNYYAVTSTTGFIGSWTSGEWLVVPFDLSTATTVGAPVVTAIDYPLITFTTSATISNFRVGGFWIALPCPNTLVYQSAAFFLASGATPSQTITNNNDTIILNDAAYAIYELRCALNVSKQSGGTLASGVIQSIKDDLYGVPGDPQRLGLIPLYRSENPSQKVPTTSNFYDD